MPPERILFKNARLVLSPNLEGHEGDLLCRKGRISGIGTFGSHEADMVADCKGDFVSPGLVDIHLHGAVGRDAMEASAESFAEILSHHASRGTTSALLTTVAAPWDRLVAVLRAAGEWGDDPGCARLEGIHLEGPWFSLRRCGAHDPAMIHPPSGEEVDALLGHAAMIRRVTLAPELPGALEVIHALRGYGIAVSAGHSDATEAEAREGFHAGITQVTHWHNAMSSLRKTDPPRRGLAEAALEDPGVLCELIADGRHLSRDLMSLALRSKGWERIALVSDATAGCGLREEAVFRLGDLECRVEEDAAWTGEGALRRLAGSTATLWDGVRTMVREVGVPLSQAIAMATIVPARALGRERDIGTLAIGARADLIRFNDRMEIRQVWKGGELLDLRPETWNLKPETWNLKAET